MTYTYIRYTCTLILEQGRKGEGGRTLANIIRHIRFPARISVARLCLVGRHKSSKKPSYVLSFLSSFM